MFKKRINYKVPRNLLVLFELLALFLIFAHDKDNFNRNTLILGMALISIIYISSFILLRISTGDNYIFLIVTMLISIGIIMIYRIDPELGMKQIIWTGIGILLFFISYFIIKSIKGWKNWTLLYGGASIAYFLSPLSLEAG